MRAQNYSAVKLNAKVVSNCWALEGLESFTPAKQAAYIVLKYKINIL